MAEVKQCESCGVIEGEHVYHETLAEFRGHKICYWCKKHWLWMETKLGMVIEFQKLIKGFTNKDFVERS